MKAVRSWLETVDRSLGVLDLAFELAGIVAFVLRTACHVAIHAVHALLHHL
jgi:hypothetical protein